MKSTIIASGKTAFLRRWCQSSMFRGELYHSVSTSSNSATVNFYRARSPAVNRKTNLDDQAVPQWQGCTVTSPATEFALLRPLRLTDLRLRYTSTNPPPDGVLVKLTNIETALLARCGSFQFLCEWNRRNVYCSREILITRSDLELQISCKANMTCIVFTDLYMNSLIESTH